MNARNQPGGARPRSAPTRPDPFAFDAKDTTIDLRPHLVELTERRCIELLESIPVGRIAFTAEDGPIVLPVNYAWFEGTVVFRTLDRELHDLIDGQFVCFEVDDWSADTRTGWSVLVRGGAREVTHWAEREQLESIGLVPWARDVWRPRWIRVEPAEMTGRELVR
ncbi:MAG: pyridoxamine 5'-phosphate oxidase family protein [Acidimicrobiales bacterium]